MMPPLLGAVACGLSLLLTQLVRLAAPSLGAVDHPAHRKMHRSPVPLLGGVAVVGAMALTLFFAEFAGVSTIRPEVAASLWAGLIAGGIIIFLCGLWDDLKPLGAHQKFLAQAAAAGLAIWSGVHIDRISFVSGYPIELGAFALPITFIWIVGLTNAFNLIDGLDGLAAGLGSIAAGTCAMIFLFAGATDDSTLLFVLLGALLGFLPFNFYPAKIFLGDSGSMVLGFLLAVSAITGSQKSNTALAVVIPFLAFGIPIVDTLLSMVRRAFRAGQPEAKTQAFWQAALRVAKQVFMADRDHIHHRLIAQGLSHRGAVLALYAAAIALSSLALLSALAHYQNALLLLITVSVATAIGIGKLGYLDAGMSRLGSVLQQVDRPKFDRSFFLGFVDLVLIGLAYGLAYTVAVGFEPSDEQRQWHRNMFPIVLLVQLSLFWMSGLYRKIWRALSVGDLIRIGVMVCAAGALSYAVVIVNDPPEGTASLFAVQTLALGWLMGAARSAYRLLDSCHFSDMAAARPVLIYGAGLGGRLVLRELHQNHTRGFRAVGYIDDDPNLQRRVVSGLPVLGPSIGFATILQERRIEALIVSSGKIGGPALRRVLAICRERGITVVRSEYEFKPISIDVERSMERTVGRVVFPSAVGHEGAAEARRFRNVIAALRRTAE